MSTGTVDNTCEEKEKDSKEKADVCTVLCRCAAWCAGDDISVGGYPVFCAAVEIR